MNIHIVVNEDIAIICTVIRATSLNDSTMELRHVTITLECNLELFN